jgi:hypothetical protein
VQRFEAMIPRRLLPAITVISMLAGSCTASTSPPAPRRVEIALTGEIVAVGSTPPPSSIVEYRLPGAVATMMTSPIGEEAANRSAFAGIPIDGGSAFVVADGGTARAYRIPAGGSDPAPIGPKLRIGSRIEPMLGIGPDAAVVSTCTGVWVMPLSGSKPWTRVGDGCWAALAPDARSVAYSPDGRFVELQPIGEDTGPSRLFDLADLRPDLGGTSRPRLVGAPAWAPQGLAFSVRAGDQLGIFVREPSGMIVEVLQERYSNTFRVPRLVWQPGGDALAISEDVGASRGVLRLFDPGTSELRVVALDAVGFAGLLWAPDGRTIAALTGTSALLLIDAEGHWLSRVKTDWKGLLAWTEPAGAGS